eukprot:24219_1
MAKTKRRYRDPDDGPYRPNEKIPKKPKQIGAPKRPLSAFFLYAQQQRPIHKQSDPPPSFGEITKLIATEWNAMGARDKKEFEDKAQEGSELYKKEKEKYLASHRYKKYKRDLEEWKDIYQEEFEEQEHEKAMKKKAKKNKKHDDKKKPKNVKKGKSKK